MTEFQFTCPHCCQRYRCDPRLAGRTLPCSGCGQQLVLTPPSEVRPADPTPSEWPPNDDSGLHLS